MASPERSVTTFTTLGSPTSRRSSILFFSVAITTSVLCSTGRMAASMASGIDERFVALNVHHDFGIFGRGHLGHPVGAGNMVAAGHAHRGSELPRGREHPLVIRGNDRAGQIAGLRGPLVHMLEHGFGGDGGQNLAGKTRGGKACGYNAQNFTAHTRSYHKIAMLDLVEERLASLHAALPPKAVCCQRRLCWELRSVEAPRIRAGPCRLCPGPRLPRSAKCFPGRTSAWTPAWC